MVTIEEQMYHKAAAGIKQYDHKKRENKQTTNLQDWLGRWGNGIPPSIDKMIRARRRCK